MEKRRISRNIILFIMFIVLMMLLGARLFYIQIICHDKLKAAAESQYELLVDGMDTRGTILDRNYMPLTGGTDQYYYFIEKNYIDEHSISEFEDIIARLEARQIAAGESPYLVYRTEIFDEGSNHELQETYHAYVFSCKTRYGDDQMACHLIGYLNEDENVGVSGLELLYQEELEAEDASIYLWADAAGNIITGSSPQKLSKEREDTFKFASEKGIVTTIDRRIQYVTEKALREKAGSGAAIVMDADTGEILAWASLPEFNPNNIESHLESGSDCLVNKVSQVGYPPGSVFKIVTAMASLEQGIDPEEEFDCNGQTTVCGITVGCLAGPEGGHGIVDLRKAMAQSCNCYFAKLGEKVGYEEVLKVAARMGFGQSALSFFPEESYGNLPTEDESGLWDTSNISIGQGEILATPIQVCQMTATIANGGYLVEPKVIMGGPEQKKRVVEKEYAVEIESCLESVMTEGTGSDNWDAKVYGKTGTAEAGSGDFSSNVCWFTGYCRQNEKTYVITIMIEDGESGTSSALPVFKRITDFLGVL